jgi:ABC-type uncharacterized transport system ATPase subunit
VELELRGITKQFPGGVLANDDVSITARSGEVLALIGENGAGKSTLMNILSGIYRPDAGEILINGVPQKFKDPGDAIAAGIGMVHQHFMLVPVFSVAENVVLGDEPIKALNFLNFKEARREVREVSKKYGLAVDPDALVESLPVGIQQRVEIIKVLLRGAEVLVFDEPTAVLTPLEVKEFFGIMEELKVRGAAIIFITHKLKEALEVADAITVMRDGVVVGNADPATATPEELASMMVGRDVELVVGKSEARPGEAILRMESVTMVDDFGRPLLDDITMDVRSGEIVGIAGIQGNGQTELVSAITGLMPLAEGTIMMSGRDITNASPRERHVFGMAHVPEDRNHMGMVPAFTVAENLILDQYYAKPFSKSGRLQRTAIMERSQELVEQFDVRPPVVSIPGEALSGGNAQKMIVAREFSHEAPFLICAQPTRGIDVGSIEYIHSQIIAKRDEGRAVLIVSTELDEIFALSDRILVMYEGRIVAERKTADTSPTEIGMYMAGRS